jgi:hypothetical protein
MEEITKVIIDPSLRMADVNREDNVWERTVSEEEKE